MSGEEPRHLELPARDGGCPVPSRRRPIPRRHHRGTSGIGLAVAAGVAEHGVTAIVGSRADSAVAQALASLPEGTIGRQVDATSAELLSNYLAQIGLIDHLVYRAGDELVVGPIGTYDKTFAAGFFDVRLLSAIDAIRAALPTLNPTGSVVLTTTAMAYRGLPGRLVGAAMSAAIIGAGKALAVELEAIRVNVVALGAFRSSWLDQVPEADRQPFIDQLAAGSLVGAIGEPAEAAKVYLGLLDQNFTTGVVSVIDGGFTV